jgi:hypothetical protein
MPIFRLCLALLLLAAPSLAFAEDIRIIGDSIGEGLHLATNIPSPANRFNVAIYTPFIFQQIKEMPRGATVFMSLGTNDAVGGALDVEQRVKAIAAAAEAQGIKLYWVGPPCVLKPWQVHSKKLDEILQAELAGTSVTYVSLQDPAFCDPSIHAGDGVHFSMAGYARLWHKAATVAGIPVEVASANASSVVSHSGGHKATNKNNRHRAKHKKKSSDVAAPANQAPPAPN